MNWPVRQKYSENKEHQKAKKHRRCWTEKRSLELRDSKAGGGPVPLARAHHGQMRYKTSEKSTAKIQRLIPEPFIARQPFFLLFALVV